MPGVGEGSCLIFQWSQVVTVLTKRVDCVWFLILVRNMRVGEVRAPRVSLARRLYFASSLVFHGRNMETTRSLKVSLNRFVADYARFIVTN